MPQHQEKRGLLNRLRTWLSEKFSRKPKNNECEIPNITAVVYLPQEATLCGGMLKIGLPPDFILVENGAGKSVFLGRKCGLVMNVAAFPLEARLQDMTQQMFQDAFLKSCEAVEILSFTHDYVRYAPRVTVHYNDMRTDGRHRCAVVFLQRRERVISLTFTGNLAEHLPTVETMISTMQA